MYLLGFVQASKPEALINTTTFNSLEELLTWLNQFFNNSDFSIDNPITKERLLESLTANVPVQINISGHDAALVFGTREVIENSITRFVKTAVFDTRDLTK